MSCELLSIEAFLASRRRRVARTGPRVITASDCPWTAPPRHSLEQSARAR